MLVTILRTAILYVFVILGLRIMGKRQIGDMQPNELVITILISEIAAIPIQDINQPVVNGIIAIFVLVVLEILVSFLSMKSVKARQVINGKSAVIVKDGKMDQKLMKRMRVTVADLMEVLRIQNVFHIDQVAYAILETNGKLSVLLKPEYQPATAEDLDKHPADDGIPALVINDGRLLKEGLSLSGASQEAVEQILKSQRLTYKQVFLMTMDKTGKHYIVKRGWKRHEETGRCRYSAFAAGRHLYRRHLDHRPKLHQNGRPAGTGSGFVCSGGYGAGSRLCGGGGKPMGGIRAVFVPLCQPCSGR